MSREDLAAPIPWTAKPERPGFPHSSWCVVDSTGSPFAFFLSQSQAREIAALHPAPAGRGCLYCGAPVTGGEVFVFDGQPAHRRCAEETEDGHGAH